MFDTEPPRNPFSRSFGEWLTDLAETVGRYVDLESAIIKAIEHTVHSDDRPLRILSVITSATLIPDTDNRYTYGWNEATVDAATGKYVLVEDTIFKSGDGFPQALNTMEMNNTDVLGPGGIELGNTADGIAKVTLKAVPSTEPVEVWFKYDSNLGSSDESVLSAWFSFPNGIEVECLPPPPGKPGEPSKDAPCTACS